MSADQAFNASEIGLYDRPRIVQPNQDQQAPQKLKLVFESDPTNNGLVTNPHSLWKQIRMDKFKELAASEQVTVLDILVQTLQKCANNCHILTDHSSAHQNSLRQNQSVINNLKSDNMPDLKQQQGCPQDMLFQLLLIGLNFDYPQVAQAIRLLGSGNPAFERCHIEVVYQYVRVAASEQTLTRALTLLAPLLEQTPIPQSYFYFNGFLSGILLNQKVVQPWPFNKGFAACMWFNISTNFMTEGKMQDPQNLPVLFNCYSQGYGGFECYFNQNKLLYRILPPIAYQPPTSDSNGFLVSEFQTGKWNYLAIEHDKPFLARAQLIAVVNDKQVVNFSMDYPKFDKASKLSQVSMCTNFIGQMSNFVLFKEQVNNPQKFVQIFKQHQADFKQFDLNVFEQRLQEKLFLMYSPYRTNGKTVYDCIDMNDGELLINCGVQGCYQTQRRPLLQEQGGLEGLLALLDKCKTTDQVNSFFKILLAILSSDSTSEHGNFFQLLFTVLQRLPHQSVNCQTIQLLTEIRFTIQTPKQNEIFFKNLLMSADFWLSTKNFEVMQEYWSFVKTIYSQNPVQHNLIFPIHNLISLMVKISADADQQLCCNYHMRTNEIFYGHSETPQTQEAKTQVDKYLEPIAGVLECVLTSGGDEILCQIDHLTRSLTLKSCPCFHIQILKLLKVLLLDSKSHHECASPIDFAQRFLNAHGLQILLHLCANNATLDVKAMCIKLIDVLSSHTSLIQMRIDTDLITYLSHVLLPANMITKPQKTVSASGREGSNEASDKPKYQWMGGDELTSPQKGLGLKFFNYQEAEAQDTDQKDNFSEQERQSDSFELIDPKKEMFSKTLNNFKTANIDELDNSASLQNSEQEDEIELKKSQQSQDEDEEFFMPAPKTKKHQPGQGFKFGGLALDDDSESNQDSQEPSQKSEPEEVQEFKPPTVSKPRGLVSLKLQDDEEDQDNFRAPPTRAEHQKRFGEMIMGDYDSDEGKTTAQKKKDEEAPKPTVDVLMSRNLRSGAGKGFNFGALASDSDSGSDQQQKDSEPEQEAEEEEVKEIVLKKPVGRGIPKFGMLGSGVKLSLNMDDDEEVKVSKPPAKTGIPRALSQQLGLNLQIDSDQNPRLAGTTGATNDDDDDQPILSQQQQPPQSKKAAFKPTLGLKLDTDKINDLFTFGGEKGEMKEEQAVEKLEDDIKELALICVTAMRKKQKPTEFQMLLEKPGQKFANNQILNTNQTVKGIKKIEMQTLLSLPDVAEEASLKSLYTPTTLNGGLMGLTTGGQFPHFAETQKSQSDDYTNELENLYTSCLEWILNRAPSQLFKTMMIDDYDKITFLPAMQVLMILVMHSNNLVRQRALQDMFMLAQWDSQNGQLLLQHKAFHQWLLELLTPYQQQCQSESSKAVYDMGSKLHTLLLKNSCTCPEEDEGFKKLNLLARWPAVIAEKGFEVEAAHDLTRTLIVNLANQLAQLPQAMKNLTHLTLQVHELVLSSSAERSRTNVDQKQGHNESLFQWVLRSQLRYSLDEQAEVYLWTDWQVSLAIVQSWDQFFIGQRMRSEDELDSTLLEKQVRSLLFAKNQDELNSIVELLMQVDQNASNTTPTHLSEHQSKSYQQKLLSLGGFTKKTQTAQKESVFMLQALVNIVCLSLTQATAQGDKVLVKQWLARLELYFKYTVMVSELWRSKSEDQAYFKTQRKMAEISAFILAFLFQEIHSNHTPKSQTEEKKSPQNDLIQKSKFFQSCLKSCLIFMINMAGIQQDQPGTRCIQVILQQILVKQYSTSSKPLISSQDISRLIESNFDEFPECFQQNDWKIAFFHNSHINAAITAQLNVEMIDGFKQKRLLYAVRLKEAEASTTQANDEILKKIQADTLTAISEVTHQEHDNRNESSLLLDFYTRHSKAGVNEWVKKVTGNRGVWQYKPVKQFLKLKSQLLGEGQRCLMKDVPSNTFSLLTDHSIEPSIMREIHQARQLLTAQEDSQFKFFTRQLSRAQLDELKFNSKQLLIDNILEGLQPSRKKIIECDQVAILKALEKRAGTLVMTNFELMFVYDITAEETNSTIFFFQWQPKQKLTKKVNLSDIKEIQKRRFLGQNKALELFLMNNKTLLIDFNDSEQRDQFAKKLLRQRQNKCKNLNYFTSLDHKHILKKSNLTEDWINCRISNFKYLMALNQLAGRSYHDLSQYPVFPWVLTLAKSGVQVPDLQAISMRGGAPPAHFRDLTKNMQLLGSAERQAEFKRKYEDLEGFDGMNDRFHCGSHYSNPGIILHYLNRVQPILEANVVLQGNAMDHPDRIFQSVQQSYSHSLNDFSDVRELIPEFYSMCEIFQNQNQINFGTKDDGTKVDDVLLPEWALKNSQKFVQVMREALESPYVSQNLNSWIDYIFGYKQRDSDAVNCLNTYSKITYQVDQPGDFDITQVQEPSMRAALENQGYNFGQTPLQLFKEEHPRKLALSQALKSNLVVDDTSKLKIFKPVPVQSVQSKHSPQGVSLISTEAIMFAKFIDNLRIIGAKKEGFAQNFLWLPRAHDQNPSISFSLGSDRKQKFNGRDTDRGIDQIDRSTKKFDYPMTISKDGNYVVKGGFWDGRVIFCPLEGAPATQFELNDHKTTVCVLAVDSNEQTLITGTKTGEVIVWRNANSDSSLDAPSQANPWVNIKQLNDHERQITSIFISEEMCLFVTSSTDSYVNMYNLWTAELIRTFTHPSQYPIYTAVIAQSPIPLCAFFSRDDHMWYAYSLNGSQLVDSQVDAQVKYEQSSHIVQPLVIKSSNLLDKLVYGTERGYIVMRTLPSLERYRKLQVSKDFPILTLLVSPDRRFLLTGCGDGGLIVITERGDQTQQQTSQTSSNAGYRSTRNSGQGSLASTSTNQTGILSQFQSLVGSRQSPGTGNNLRN